MKTAKPSASQTDNAALALRRFRVVFNAVRTHFRHVEKETGLGGAQVWALSLIQQNPGMGVGEVSAKMDIHQSTASNLIKILVKKDLLTLSKSDGDKRAVELRVTAEGKKAIKKIPGPFEGVLPEALRQLDDATLASLNRDLEKLMHVLEADEDAGSIPLAHL
ncbi:MarR family winged helix-turn-helix transcriptional regulator [Rhodoferax saidenbachensis]|uniref:MarR family transcriptional regulator n=1 Tax=Rhodoferax saidenbachensis TaxID=1484693 RepID=A0A1P8KBZ0_9BURK|nr:MarR family transcriptional regulator [Rhodoferax saidenbachensis]APW43547.1 MarR family transcriptional regulator [Rhodoferax saidenbachensis]